MFECFESLVLRFDGVDRSGYGGYYGSKMDRKAYDVCFFFSGNITWRCTV